MRILVCGGRDFSKYNQVFYAISRLKNTYGVEAVIHGGARGADSLAGQAAEELGIPVEVYPADWKTHGKKAGLIRNQQMIDEGKPDAVVAFHGGRGTADMLRRAKEAGLPVWITQ